MSIIYPRSLMNLKALLADKLPLQIFSGKYITFQEGIYSAKLCLA